MAHSVKDWPWSSYHPACVGCIGHVIQHGMLLSNFSKTQMNAIERRKKTGHREIVPKVIVNILL